ncbi:uncharacterized protein LOC123381925 isoform X1 [Felis catus]|uniref:uncharacterized protein LOC123381925 isoform X1 n=1 Tax=Felis catus TaxID=9685 RepID=UPI001D1A0F98|nr:uncharacterized protein LOC123381925 isoform X1 [Felis catus]XP_044900537.1 uncharacterized protein LOC123381925 isoform X1 [Felis catus]XP_044900538.1 uncharacterized protein LOC123381925 isoform X1 [Felis catus]XP_044900539.1 uncharacterized protein LOC123381925 isoform X1 [Felis catus]XP_044900540.1 uncharacterized protein LOC123381925 isoform X1 [Felis catus]XP_044900541.1 uncharacterized protein LOC123381925 isoform X1 [Felis catus]XP_044900542.1 uncharacterized protein LOC123381925 i
MFSSPQAEAPSPLNANSALHIPPAPGSLLATFWLYQSTYCLRLASMESRSICAFMTGLFHSAQCPQGSSVLSPMAEFPSFLQLRNIPLHAYRVLCVSVFPVTDAWVVSTFRCREGCSRGHGCHTHLFPSLLALLLCLLRKFFSHTCGHEGPHQKCAQMRPSFLPELPYPVPGGPPPPSPGPLPSLPPRSSPRPLLASPPPDIFFLSLRERKNGGGGAEGEREGERDSDTGSTLSAWTPMRGSMPRPWDRDLGQNQESRTQPTELPRHFLYQHFLNLILQPESFQRQFWSYPLPVRTLQWLLMTRRRKPQHSQSCPSGPAHAFPPILCAEVTFACLSTLGSTRLSPFAQHVLAWAVLPAPAMS